MGLNFAVPLDTRFSDIEIRFNDMVICSETKPSSSERHEWCRITKNLGQGSATLRNIRLRESFFLCCFLCLHFLIFFCLLISSDAILVDEAIISKHGAVDIISGSEIVPGPGLQGSTCLVFFSVSSRKWPFLM